MSFFSTPNPPDVGPTAITWPVFTEEEQEYLVLDMKPRVERRYKAKNMAFWNQMIPKMAKIVTDERKAVDEKVPNVCIDDERASNFCLKARNPCFCEENHHFMYNYCKDSCNWCDSSENVGEQL